MGHPDYFEIAKGLMMAQGQEMLDRIKQIEEEAELPVVLVECDQCGEHFELEMQGVEIDGKDFCSSECLSKHNEDEDDGYCVMCDGTGEGQFDGASCPACKGKGFIRGASHDDF